MVEAIIRKWIKLIAVIAALAAISTPLAADWNVTRYIDDRTRQAFNIATLPATNQQAQIRLRCINDRIFPDIVLAQPVAPPDIVRIRASQQFDTAPATSRMVALYDKGRELWLWSDQPYSTLLRIARARRLLVEVFPPEGEARSFEFDLTGADKVVPQVQCAQPKPPVTDQ
jgi:hypothetical protein